MEVAVSGLRVRIVVPLLAIPMMALWSFAPTTTAASAPPSQLDVILAKFNNGPPPVYRAFRRLEAGTRGTSKHGWLEVWTENRPGAGFSYTRSDERRVGNDLVLMWPRPLANKK